MKVKYTISILVFFLISSRAFPQVIVSDSILFHPRWQINEKKIFTVKEYKNISGGSFGAFSAENIFKMSFNVLDTANGYTINVKFNTISYKNENLESYSILAQIRDKLEFIYKINRQGNIIQVQNLKEISDKIIRKIDSLTSNKEFSELDKVLIVQFDTLARIPNGIIGVFLKPLTYYHDLFNRKFSINKKLFNWSESDNAFGGTPFPGVNILVVNKLDSINDNAKVSMDRLFNTGKLTEIQKTEMEPRLEQLINKELLEDFPKYITARNQYKFDIQVSTGWIKKLWTNQVIRLPDGTGTEEIEMSLDTN